MDIIPREVYDKFMLNINTSLKTLYDDIKKSLKYPSKEESFYETFFTISIILAQKYEGQIDQLLVRSVNIDPNGFIDLSETSDNTNKESPNPFWKKVLFLTIKFEKINNSELWFDKDYTKEVKSFVEKNKKYWKY